MALTLEQARSKQTIRAGIIARLHFAHGAIHEKEFSAEQRAELESLASLGLILKMPRQMYTVIQPSRRRRAK
jgi:hypothetical protein